jgi:hypothetical protein
MRIGLGAVLLVQAYVLWKYRGLLLNPEGPIPWTLGDSWIDPLMPKLSDLLPLFASLGLGADAVVAFVLAVHALAAAFLMLGYRTRAAAFFAWITFVLLKDSSPAFLYGVGAMLLIALFYSVLMPVGREFSLDRALKVKAQPTAGDASFCVLVLRLHMCIVYGFSGIAKSAGEQWWSGDALWRALSLPQFSQFDPAFLASMPLLVQALSIFTVLSQLAYPILVWTRARVAVVVLMELLHLGIAIFLGLWLFSAVMILLNTAAFGEALWKALARRPA